MNRNDEWNQLINEIVNEPVPAALDIAVSKGINKYKRTARRNHIFYPLATLCAAFAAFVLSVNLFPAFATACSRIPILKDLAEAVKFSPSLSTAVDNDYVQEMRLEQTQDGITMRVEYVIVDQSQLNIFYTLSSEQYQALDGTPSIYSMSHEFLPVCIMSGCNTDQQNSLQHITVDFNEMKMPNRLIFDLAIRDLGSYQKTIIDPYAEQTSKDSTIEASPSKNDWSELFDQDDMTVSEPVTTFSFTLSFDPYYTEQGEIVPLNESFTIGKENFTLKQYRIYPTYLGIDLSADSVNTQWLRSLDYYVTDEHGNKYESAGGCGSSDGTPGFLSYRVDSSYFMNAKHLTLYITKAYWMDKTDNLATIDLVNRSCTNLPDGVTLSYCKKHNNDYHISFCINRNDTTSMRQIFTSDYFAPDGTQSYISTWSYTTDGCLFEDHISADPDSSSYYVSFVLYDYSYDLVSLQLSETGSTTLTEPIQIPIK